MILNFTAMDPGVLEIGPHHGRFDVVQGSSCALSPFPSSLAFFQFVNPIFVH